MSSPGEGVVFPLSDKNGALGILAKSLSGLRDTVNILSRQTSGSGSRRRHRNAILPDCSTPRPGVHV